MSIQSNVVKSKHSIFNKEVRYVAVNTVVVEAKTFSIYSAEVVPGSSLCGLSVKVIFIGA